MFSMIRGGDETNYNIKHNGVDEPVDEVMQLVSPDIPFQIIFKKTNLGSVPAESFLLSSPGETQIEFKDRLVKIFNSVTTVDSLREDLKHKDKYNLKILSSKDSTKIDAKLQQIAEYIADIRKNVSDLSIFSNIDNYKPIQHRKETRFYFRNKALKKCAFVYELNPNPCASFFFTSNPSDGSTDYFGYCGYDITRNSSPGCCRTVPLADVETNLTDDFKKYWIENVGEDVPYILVFSYIKYISESKWYREQKKQRRRFYFCIPKTFVTEWLDNLDIEAETKSIQSFLPELKKQQESESLKLFEIID
jgi:hypothetical protein